MSHLPVKRFTASQSLILLTQNSYRSNENENKRLFSSTKNNDMGDDRSFHEITPLIVCRSQVDFFIKLPGKDGQPVRRFCVRPLLTRRVQEPLTASVDGPNKTFCNYVLRNQSREQSPSASGTANTII